MAIYVDLVGNICHGVGVGVAPAATAATANILSNYVDGHSSIQYHVAGLFREDCVCTLG